jgi:hypothetical protein
MQEDAPESVLDKSNPKPLDEVDIALLKTYVRNILLKFLIIDFFYILLYNFTHSYFQKGVGPYAKSIKLVENDIQKILQNINEICGIILF